MAQGESAMELDEPTGELVLGEAAAGGNAEAQHEAAGSSDPAPRGSSDQAARGSGDQAPRGSSGQATRGSSGQATRGLE